MKNIVAKLGIAGSTSLLVTETLNLDTLISALITLAISIVSVLSVEGINWLRNYIKSKTKEVKDKDETKE